VLPVWEAPSTSPLVRGVAAFWRQRTRSVRCPDAPRLDGRLALVTGGNAGIGFETSRGLARRGAEVIVACRSEAKAADALAALAREPALAAPPRWLPLDLADLASVRGAAERLAGGRPLDVLVQNAGLWPERHAVSAQGHEIAFATNVLGHFALARALEARGLLGSARLVIVTGDIYVGARSCTPDFRYRGGGAAAYRRSKLGNLWLTREWARRRPALCAVAVHPGVVASNLVRGFDAVKRLVLLDCEAGAQASLFAATQPGLASGSYLHNTAGLVRLAPDDPAADASGAAALWETCEAAAQPFL
jgi:NAD(P)-dependent dehydrogenase (short-subunit alcohol dehydrogenase family)